MSENSERTATARFADIARPATRSRKARKRGVWRDEDTLQDEMRDLPLSVEVRSGWRSLDQQFEAADGVAFAPNQTTIEEIHAMLYRVFARVDGRWTAIGLDAMSRSEARRTAAMMLPVGAAFVVWRVLP